VTEPRPETESELIDFVRAIDVRAPRSLHERIEELVGEQAAPGRGRRAPAGSRRPQATLGRRLAAGLALATAVVAVLVVSLAGGGGVGAGPTVSEASTLTLSPATAAAPREDGRGAARLDVDVDGVWFPYWEDRFGWRAIGSRTDHVGGRTVRTVFYANSRGQRIGYAIVAGTPAPSAGGGVVTSRWGTRYTLLSEHGVRVVTWLRDGHRCVVAGRGVSGATLLTLASWDARGESTT
jgi:hypothetical protein